MEPVFKTEGTCLTIILPGEVDHPVSDYVRKTADRIMEKIYIKTIEFDFSETTFMDSSGSDYGKIQNPWYVQRMYQSYPCKSPY